MNSFMCDFVCMSKILYEIVRYKNVVFILLSFLNEKILEMLRDFLFWQGIGVFRIVIILNCIIQYERFLFLFFFLLFEIQQE